MSNAANIFRLQLSLQTPLSYEDFIHTLSFCGDNMVNVPAEDLLDLHYNFVFLDTELDVFPSLIFQRSLGDKSRIRFGKQPRARCSILLEMYLYK